MTVSDRTLLLIDPEGNIASRISAELAGWEIITAKDSDDAAKNLRESLGISVLAASVQALGRLWPLPVNRLGQTAQVVLITKDQELADLIHGQTLNQSPPLIGTHSSGLAWRRQIESALEAFRGCTSTPPDPGTSQPVRAEPDASSEIRIKEDWVKVVAHDIRSPLTILNSYMALLLKEEHRISQEGRIILERMRSTGGWMIDLIDNILDISMLREGRLTLKSSPVRLMDILSSVADKLNFLAESRQVRLDCEDPQDLNYYHLDHIKIEQVLHNLAINGIKFSDQGGRVLLTSHGGSDVVTFTVTDSGPGMTRQEAEHIFDKFSQQNPDKNIGKGLGLAIAKSLVELHGGDIWVKSQPGQGSVFSFTVRSLP